MVAEELVRNGPFRHGLFWAHLCIEKTLKALVAGHTRGHPPRTHDLVYLAGMACLELDAETVRRLKDFSDYNIEGRYPDALPPQPEADLARMEMAWAWAFVTRWTARR